MSPTPKISLKFPTSKLRVKELLWQVQRGRRRHKNMRNLPKVTLTIRQDLKPFCSQSIGYLFIHFYPDVSKLQRKSSGSETGFPDLT